MKYLYSEAMERTTNLLLGDPVRFKFINCELIVNIRKLDFRAKNNTKDKGFYNDKGVNP